MRAVESRNENVLWGGNVENSLSLHLRTCLEGDENVLQGGKDGDREPLIWHFWTCARGNKNFLWRGDVRSLRRHLYAQREMRIFSGEARFDV